MSLCNVTLMRHGETESNAQKRLGGQDDHLSKIGKEQVLACAKKFLSYPMQRIITSDAKRSRETAALIAQRIHVPILISPLVREKSSGMWAGKTEASVNWAELRGDFYTRKIPGGESINDVIARAGAFQRALEEEQANTLVISHGTFIKVLLARMLRQDVHEFILRTTIPNSAHATVVFDTATQTWTINETEFSGVL